MNHKLTELELSFLYYLNACGTGLPEPVAQHRFDAVRRWRFDFAWLDQRVAVELDGGVHVNGRHVRGTGYEADCEKLNAALVQGWRVLRFTRGMLERDPDTCIKQVAALVWNLKTVVQHGD